MKNIKEEAKRKSLRYLVGHIKNGKNVFYKEFAEYLRDITTGKIDFTNFRLGINRKKLGNFLGELSCEENKNGRGMISVFVVHKENLLPHDSFFNYAKELDYDVSDKLKFQKEMEQIVYKAWKDKEVD